MFIPLFNRYCGPISLFQGIAFFNNLYNKSTYDLRNGNTPKILFNKVAEGMRRIKHDVEDNPVIFSRRSVETVATWTEEVNCTFDNI